jgi:hypothetical protein
MAHPSSDRETQPMMTRPIADLVQIVRNGGSLDLQAGNLSTDELLQLVRNELDPENETVG